MGMKKLGEKVAGHAEKASKFGQKATGAIAKFGKKAASTIKTIKTAVADTPMGKFADMPVYKGVSANQAADLAINALNKGAEVAGRGQRSLRAGDNVIRAGRALGAASTAGERIAAGKEMMRAGQSVRQIANPSAPAPPPPRAIQKP